MKITGGCYCRAVRYEAEGEPLMRVQCHCRECQIVSGGGPVLILGMPEEGFRFTKGAPKDFTRSDIDNPVTREFCAECGTHLLTRAPGMPGVMLKVGSLDDPSLFERPQMVVFAREAQAYHHVPEGPAVFAGLPG